MEAVRRFSIIWYFTAVLVFLLVSVYSEDSDETESSVPDENYSSSSNDSYEFTFPPIDTTNASGNAKEPFSVIRLPKKGRRFKSRVLKTTPRPTDVKLKK